MKKIMLTYALFFGILALISSTQKEIKSEPKIMTKKIEKKTDELGEDFDSFYNKFITDLPFQLSRVTFPLECYIAEEEDTVVKLLNKKDWQPFAIHIDEVDRDEYIVETTNTDTEATQRIYVEDSSVDILVKYQKIEGKWYVIYYKSIFF